MDKHIFKILDPLHQEVMGSKLDEKTYHLFAKNVRLDRSPASLARIKESLIESRDNFNASITSPCDREIIFLKNDNVVMTRNDETILKDKNILIISVIIADLIPNVFETFVFEDLPQHFGKVMFYFVTTSSTIYDKLSTLPLSYGFLIPEEMQSSIDFTNINILAHFKNQCYQMAKAQFNEETIDWLVYLDTKWSDINLNGFISSFKTFPKTCDVICGNRMFKKSYVHTDAQELFFPEEEICSISNKYKYYDKFSKTLYWMDKFYSFESWYKVKSAFGGVFILNKKALCLDVLFDEENANGISENVTLCTKFLNIYVNPFMRLYSLTTVEGILYPTPSIFVPPDLNICGTLNLFIKCLTSGARIYPFFNTSIIHEKNKANQSNFIYHNEDIENSWMQFFEPLQFYDNDDTHTNSKDLLSFSHTQGEDIHMDVPLIQYHFLFNKFVRFNDSIISRIIMFSPEEKIIGVIYNHPKIQNEYLLFKEYFDEINKIILGHKIFLYTDTELAIAAFSSEYKDQLIYDPQFQRLNLDHTILWGSQLKPIRNLDKRIDRGIDELSNVASLAKCEWLICSKNCDIGKTCRIINPDIQTVFL